MSSEHRRGGPERARFVKRAMTLKYDRAFLNTCEDHAAKWNARFPEFPVRTIRICPEAHNCASDDYMLPPVLERYRVFPLHEGVRNPQRLSAATDHEITQSRIIRAKQAWRSLVSQVCLMFWPKRNFPHWLNCPEHPAHHFVAACMIWQEPKLVPEEWILDARLQIVSLRFHPSNSADDDPETLEWRTRYETLVRRLTEVAEQEGSVVLSDISGIRAECEAAAKRVRENVESQQVDVPAVLPYPGMPVDEYRRHAPSVGALLKQQFDIAERIREMHREGSTKSEVARLLGIERKAVQMVLDTDASARCDFA